MVAMRPTKGRRPESEGKAVSCSSPRGKKKMEKALQPNEIPQFLKRKDRNIRHLPGSHEKREGGGDGDVYIATTKKSGSLETSCCDIRSRHFSEEKNLLPRGKSRSGEKNAPTLDRKNSLLGGEGERAPRGREKRGGPADGGKKNV